MKHRFRSLEIGIFSVVSLVFLNSVYNLVTNGQILGATPLGAIKPTRNVSSVEGQKPDAFEHFATYETHCLVKGESFATDASKVRIKGVFCGSPPPESESLEQTHPVDYKVKNKTTGYLATVLSENEVGRFSTDFIPLENGPNNILMEFKYRGVKSQSYGIIIDKK